MNTRKIITYKPLRLKNGYKATYMGMYSEYVYTYKGETYGDYITDDEAWHNEEKIMSAACYCFGLSPDEVEIVKR